MRDDILHPAIFTLVSSGKASPVRVSFLSLVATRELLANPTDDFPLDFTRETIERVFDHVRGQPYLTQLIGHTLVRRYNLARFEQGVDRLPRFTPEDVDEVVDAPEFYEQGNYYFRGVWQQAEHSELTGQAALLQALAAADGALPPDEWFNQAGLSAGDGKASLDMLVQHDVVVKAGEAYVFAVPLMRRWLRMR